ncbi:MAG: polyphosphate polymerase domain-containing protein [Crenarchaeota archaeon]|nr:polyphosphate polymerase domain-containing protein [Thermoproteota archaeon]
MNPFIEKHLRHELKYRIGQTQYQLLRKEILTILKHDENANPDGSYHIRNLYFDDFKNTALKEKIDGVVNRRKWRMRIYNCSDEVIKFERKTKLNEYILKESVKISREDAQKIINDDIEFLKDSKVKLLNEFYWESRCKLLKPVVIVDYYREAYVYPVGTVRITFDMQLQTGLGSVDFFDPNASTVSVEDEPGLILEIKFNDVLPQHIRGLFLNTIRPRSAIGKFAICRIQQMNKSGPPTASPKNMLLNKNM